MAAEGPSLSLPQSSLHVLPPALPLSFIITRVFVTCLQLQAASGFCLGAHLTHLAVWIQVHKVAGAEAKLMDCSVLLWIKL